MGVEEDFKLAADEAKTLPEKTTNDDKLKLYGLYKQGTEGDVNTSAPVFSQAELSNKAVQPMCIICELVIDGCRWLFDDTFSFLHN